MSGGSSKSHWALAEDNETGTATGLLRRILKQEQPLGFCGGQRKWNSHWAFAEDWGSHDDNDDDDDDKKVHAQKACKEESFNEQAKHRIIGTSNCNKKCCWWCVRKSMQTIVLRWNGMEWNEINRKFENTDKVLCSILP